MDRPRLLLVEDDQKYCRLLKNYLEPLGYEVEAVHDGRVGLARALEEPRAALILDVMLPGMNGLDLLRELRKTSQTPVLMLTALGDEVDRITGLEMGADDYLPKTFSTREYLHGLQEDVTEMTRLTDDLLQLAREELLARTAVARPTDVASAVPRACRIESRPGDDIRHGLEVRLTLPRVAQSSAVFAAALNPAEYS